MLRPGPPESPRPQVRRRAEPRIPERKPPVILPMMMPPARSVVTLRAGPFVVSSAARPAGDRWQLPGRCCRVGGSRLQPGCPDTLRGLPRYVGGPVPSAVPASPPLRAVPGHVVTPPATASPRDQLGSVEGVRGRVRFTPARAGLRRLCRLPCHPVPRTHGAAPEGHQRLLGGPDPRQRVGPQRCLGLSYGLPGVGSGSPGRDTRAGTGSATRAPPGAGVQGKRLRRASGPLDTHPHEHRQHPRRPPDGGWGKTPRTAVRVRSARDLRRQAGGPERTRRHPGRPAHGATGPPPHHPTGAPPGSRCHPPESRSRRGTALRVLRQQPPARHHDPLAHWALP